MNAGRGTEFQFQRYGASFLDSTHYQFKYWPQPNFGSKYPKENGKKVFGKDLSKHPKMNRVSIEWLVDAYTHSVDKSNFFKTDAFTKHAGNSRLQQQIAEGVSVELIQASWQKDLAEFKKLREKYLLYP